MENQISHMAEMLEKIRENGISKGLSDKEIDTCLLSCLCEWKSNDVNSNYSKFTCVKQGHNKTKFLLIGFFVTVLLATAVIYFQDANDFLYKFISRHVLYRAMRLVRLAALPFVTRIDLSSWHDELCAVPNPLFADDEITCNMYDQASTFNTVHHLDTRTFHIKYFEFMKSVHVKKSHKPMKFQDIKKLYSEKTQLAQSGLNIVHSNDGSVSDLKQLMNLNEEVLKLDENFQIQWMARGIGTCRFLSKIFPRPEFMKKAYEISLEKIVILDSMNTKSYDLPQTVFAHVWYTQLSGKRMLQFSPKERCSEKVQPKQLIIEAGDIVYFHAPLWNIESIPVPIESQDGENALTLSYMGSFDP